ncbi:MAG: sigma-70 family RNA polymerase sigma factor [Myxococcales bacterium]|nr:sigma-70 family RNA polymerase sigma factor [Myxococcales bacterium]
MSVAPDTVTQLPDPGRPHRTTFDVVYRGMLGFVRQVVHRQPVPPADRDDVVQDVFVIAYRRWEQLESTESLRAWLHSIAVRTCWNYQRAHRRWSLRFAPSCDEIEDYMDVEGSVADQQLAHLEDLRQLGQAVDRLQDKRREALVLSRIEGRSALEVSRITGLSPNTVSSRIRAALFALREDLTMSEIPPPDAARATGAKKMTSCAR